MESFSVETLRMVMVCPAQVHYSLHNKPDSTSETAVFDLAVARAMHNIFDTGAGFKNVRKVWLRQVKSYGLLNSPAKDLMISNGMVTLSTFSKWLEKCARVKEGVTVGITIGSTTHFFLYPMAVAIGSNAVAPVVVSSYSPNTRYLWAGVDGAILRLGRFPWYECSVHSGRPSQVRREPSKKGDMRFIGSLLAHANLAAGDHYHPVSGVHCKTCSWRGACKDEFRTG